VGRLLDLFNLDMPGTRRWSGVSGPVRRLGDADRHTIGSSRT
jgi:hypothetical protein